MEEDIFNSEIIKQKFQLNKKRSEKLVEIFRAMLQARSSKLSKLSRILRSKNHELSDYRGMQRFFADTELCEITCAKTIMEMLDLAPQEKLILIFDRTYWMRGKIHLNFLYLSVFVKGYGIPIFFKMMPDKKGHSSVGDRKELLDNFINQFGKERIDYVVADREFDGSEWLNYLKTSDIRYVQRMKEGTICMADSRGKLVRAKDLCRHIKPLEKESFGKRRIYRSKEFTSSVTVTKSQKGNIILLAHSDDIEDPTYAYGFRWGIELGFRALKSGGFNIEDTGLTKPNRVVTLHRIVAILTAFCYKCGMMINELTPIKNKSHGRKSISFIKLFLDFIQSAQHKVLPNFKHIMKFLKPLLKLSFFKFCHVH